MASKPSGSSPTFSVDTHLFTELGELLVGRDSTALIELVKNAYDADATQVTVLGHQIADSNAGFIRIVDDGIGMTEPQFVSGFLRIAGREKQKGNRRSLEFSRRFTGAKGIGRLAAHKLARVLEVESIAAVAQQGREQLHAVIDWDAIEGLSTLDDVRGSGAIQLTSTKVREDSPHGTSISLRRLRRPWSKQEKDLFLTEIQTFEPPRILWRPLPRTVVPEPVLFKTLDVRDSSRDDKRFAIALEGDFASGEDYWQALAEQASWVLEIEAKAGSNKITFGLAPTEQARKKDPNLSKQTVALARRDHKQGPYFTARILCREGGWPRSVTQSDLIRRSYGIRVFVEGFRVLPYGEPGNDWLSLDSHYTSRGRTLPNLAILSENIPVKQEGLTSLPNSNYIGGVFLTVEGAPELRTLVNREGFLPNQAFEELTFITRLGIDLLTRTRARFSIASRDKRRRARLRVGETGLGAALSESLDRTTQIAKEARSLVAEKNTAAAGTKLAAAVSEIESVSRLAREIVSQVEIIRVLASVGTQLAAFIHEVQGLLGTTATVESALERLHDDPSLSLAMRGQIGIILRSVAELRQRLDRQSAYLLDVVSADARRRRMRMSLAIRFDTAVRLLGMQAAGRRIAIENKIPEDVVSPRMFPAETTAIFTNLLSNAIKAAGDGGRVVASGSSRTTGTTRIRIDNTGDRVDLENAEEWFAPYTSTTQSLDPALGQGMGLGLPITRAILAEYGSTIGFVAPKPGFATAIEVVFPEET